MAVDEGRLVAGVRNSAEEKGQQKDERDSSGHVAQWSLSGNHWVCSQNLWLENGKVGSQVVGEDGSRLPERGAVGEGRRGGR